MTDLTSITGSRVRASILSELFGDKGGTRSISELAQAAGVHRSAAFKAVRGLVASGVLRPTGPSRVHGSRYAADQSFAGYADLRRFILVWTGAAGEIRRALAAVDSHQLAWIHGPYAVDRPILRQIRLVAVTRDPSRVRAVVEGLRTSYLVTSDVMTVAEWTRRVEKRELRVLAIRRAPRLWLLGSDAALAHEERVEAWSHQTWKRAIANWREEAEWDEDYDEFMRPLRPSG